MTISDAGEMQLIVMYRRLDSNDKKHLLLQAEAMVDTAEMEKPYVELDGIRYIKDHS